MFDLEQAIARWHRQMLDGGVRQHDVLDELESHLREAIEEQLRSGLDARNAFNAAVARLGESRTLKHEFAMSLTAMDRLKDFIFTLAGIPNQNLETTMNTTRVEPAWATYLKAATFLLPAIFLAILSAIFVVPKLQEICRDAGLPEAMAGTFWNLTYSSIQVMLVIANHGLLIVGALLCAVLLLEWRSAQWPRYRRAAIGVGAFILNSMVLFAFFMMFIAAIVAAPALAKLPK